MGQILAHDEWMLVKPPFSYLRIEKVQEEIYSNMMVKWIERHCSGWVWTTDTIYVFEHKSDMMMFTVWLKSDPFSEDNGDIK